MTNEALWKAIIGELQISASEIDLKTFFPQVDIETFEKNVLTLRCTSKIVKERIENRYYNQIKNIAEKITKGKIELSLLVKNVPQDSKENVELGPLFKKKSTPTRTYETNLYPNYTFENFVVGPNNRLAHTVALAVCENPGSAYNPFFLYSSVGLGKTHLIQAIGNRILEKHPTLHVLYCTGESFTNELLESLRQLRVRNRGGSLTRFKEKYRKVDVLLIDDVQFIAGKDTTQEEFFHAFNTLYMAGKQIVLTSDRPPNEIEKLEKRMSSRFASGMVADMQMPDADVRSAILRNKKESLGINIGNECVDYIAQNTKTNIRELEGRFLQIVTELQASKKPLTLENVQEIMGLRQKKVKITPNEIIKSVASYYTLKLKDIKGTRRLKEIVFPRQIAMYLIRTEAGTPFIDIGNIFGGKDHSTVMHAVRKIEEELNKNTKIKQDLYNIKKSLGL